MKRCAGIDKLFNREVNKIKFKAIINKSVLLVLIIVTGLYCVVHIIFDLSFNPTIKLATNIIEALLFLFSFIYVSVDFEK